jgi:hypothetical protein
MLINQVPKMSINQVPKMSINQVPKMSIKRWGFLAEAGEELVGREPHLKWEDFDHLETLSLADSGSTTIGFLKTYNNMVLRFCPVELYTAQRRYLVELELPSPGLLVTKGVFNHGDLVYVASELSDVSLADIIDGTISLQEVHISTILGQVSFHDLHEGVTNDQIAQSLRDLNDHVPKDGPRMIYGSLQAENVFISRKGTVKLGKVDPGVVRTRSRKKSNIRDQGEASGPHGAQSAPRSMGPRFSRESHHLAQP